MPSLFRGASIETLLARREDVDREMASLVAFRDRIDRRIDHLRARPMTGFIASLNDDQVAALQAQGEKTDG